MVFPLLPPIWIVISWCRRCCLDDLCLWCWSVSGFLSTPEWAAMSSVHLQGMGMNACKILQGVFLYYLLMKLLSCQGKGNAFCLFWMFFTTWAFGKRNCLRCFLLLAAVLLFRSEGELHDRPSSLNLFPGKFVRSCIVKHFFLLCLNHRLFFCGI